MAEMQRPRRAPAVERFVNEISEQDIRVKVFGTISGNKNGLAILEDETGKIGVDSKEQLEKGAKLIVFGRPIKNNSTLELQAEIVKSAAGLNEKLYKKAHSLITKGGL